MQLNASPLRHLIEISIDNTTIVSYINKQVGLRSGALCETALEIYSWCEARKIDLHAIYLRGCSNLVAVTESPKPVAAGDWKLSTSAFQKIHQAWKSEVDFQYLSAVSLSRAHG